MKHSDRSAALRSSKISTSSVLAPITLLLVTGACGGDQPGIQISLDAGETAALDGAGFALAGEEITTEAPTLAVKVGEEVTINYENKQGQYSQTIGSHDLVITPQLDDIHTMIAAGKVVSVQTGEVIDHVLWDSVIPRLQPGESASVTFIPDAPGSYYYLCSIPTHARRGMIGEFIVEG